MITSENDFAFIRRILLTKPTIPQHQIASRIAQTTNVNSEEQVPYPSVKERLTEQTENNMNLIVHSKHEKRLAANKKEIHQIWNQTFQQTPVMNTRLIIDNRNNHNLTKELVKRRPQL